MKNKILGALAALAIALGLTVVVASPAEAHTSGGTYSSVCQTDGTYKLTWTVFADNAPGGSTVTVTAINPASLGSSSGPGNQDQKFEQIVPGNTVQPEASFHVEWSDGYIVSPVILKALLLNGTCEPGSNSDPITYCHATSSDTNPYELLTTSKNAFYQSGHIDHDGDIFPAGSIVKQGQTISWDAQGDQSLLAYPDCVKPVTPPVDVCDNLEGDQETVPDGYVQDGDDCVIPPPAAQECVKLSAWGTEADDQAPILTEDGLLFEGGSGDAVGYGVALSGNLQGLPTITYAATGDLDVFYPRIVINSLADGGYAYDSLTIISEGPITGDSIAASNKRGFIQKTLDEWAALLPNNQLLAFFFHLDSGASADKAVTLSSVTSDCFSANFVPPVPEGSSRQVTVEGEPDCEAGTVTSTTYFYETEPVWNPTTLEYDLVETLVDTEESSREATLEECPPTATEPPVEEEELPTPPALAPTGQEVTTSLLIGGGLVAVGVLALLFVLRNRKATKRLI